MAHNYVDNFKVLATTKRAVIHYDQLGCGLSSHIPDAPSEFWSVSLYLDELNNLLSYLNISHYDLLGQSWGGMLALEHAVKQPPGLRRLILASSPSDLPLGIIEVNLLRDQLPPEVQQTLLKHEEAGTTDDPEYQEAIRVFNNRYLCRVPPPPELAATEAQYLADPTVYRTMWGPSEFYLTGILKDWTIIDRLSQIKVPTLTYSGLYDEATPRTQVPFAEHIAGIVRQVLFKESSHLPHIEEHEDTMNLIRDFLDSD